MEAVAPVMSLATETGKSVYYKIKTSVKFNDNLAELEKKMTNLKELRDEINQRLELARIYGRSAAAAVDSWLRAVNDVEHKLFSIQQDVLLKRHFLGIRHGRRVGRITLQVEGLLKDGNFSDSMISVDNYQATAVEHIPGPVIEDETSASETLAQLMKILEDNKFHRIGIWGMGGVGKTTLVKNLNNKLKTTTKQLFSVVIWVTVSQELDMKKVQTQIAERLYLKVNMDVGMEQTATRLYQRLQKEKSFLLILDDVWEEIDLYRLGVPHHRDHPGSNIILTSRSSDVCRQMVTDIEVKMNVLSDKEAWKLFSQYAGEVVDLRGIQRLANEVVRECCGLPLALITVGCVMRKKNKVELWQHALSELRRSVHSMRGVTDKVYNSLKLSYDSLESNSNIKACFLYCALYPEDFSIEASELVASWVAEALIHEQDSFDDSINSGMALVEILKDCCLLEEGDYDGTVKMHDVVRDVAIWIATSLNNEYKPLVRSGIGLTEISEAQLSSKSLKRVSFMNNKINKLPDCEIHCSEVSTLLLQGNIPLDTVPEKFLQGFLALRVLNLGGTRIRSLPPSLLQLSVLSALLLGNCFFLEVLPPLGALSGLQILDLSATNIRQLPEEMENLINLKQLNLSRTRNLNKIKAGIISKLVCLEVLDMAFSAHIWDEKREVENGQASLEELGCLKRLNSLSVWFKSIPRLTPQDFSWIRGLSKFQAFVGSNAEFFSVNKHDKRMVAICGPRLEDGCEELLSNASSLFMKSCTGTVMINSPNDIQGSIRLDSFVGLKSLTIMSSDIDFRPADQKAYSSADLLPHLEEIHLHKLSGTKSISHLLGKLGVAFSRLKLIEVEECETMEYLFVFIDGDFMMRNTLPNLEAVKVSACRCLNELFLFDSQTKNLQSVAPNLRNLELWNLNNLCNIGKLKNLWLNLEYVEVFSCPRLVYLPLTLKNASIKEIRGEELWWSKVSMYDKNTKKFMQQYFKAFKTAARENHHSELNTRHVDSSSFMAIDGW